MMMLTTHHRLTLSLVCSLLLSPLSPPALPSPPVSCECCWLILLQTFEVLISISSQMLKMRSLIKFCRPIARDFPELYYS